MIILCFQWKLVNLKTFESLNIIKYWSLKERKHYGLKETENIKNAKKAWITWPHNVLAEMFTITEKSALLHKKSNFWSVPA